MLKILLPNSDIILQECINQTFEYLKAYPQDFSKKKKTTVTKDIIAKDIGSWFEKSLEFSKRTTVPDELVSDLLELIVGVDPKKRTQVQEQYWRQKKIEMMLGDFLEMYLLKHSFAYGWIQTGNCVQGTDMIKKNNDGRWLKLQIKNSDNTPNSSSAGFIADKALTWSRRNSSKGGQYWNEFPDQQVCPHLSEKTFLDFIKSYFA